MDNSADYLPGSLHEALTYVLGLPVDASAEDIAAALKEAAAKPSKKKEGEHPDSHMILVEAIDSPSEDESDALRTLLKVAEKMAAKNKKMKAAMRLTAAVGETGGDDYGYKWEMQIVEFGPDKQQSIFWEPDALRAAISFYEGSKVFALTEAQHQEKAHRYGKSVKDLVGWMSDVKENDKGLTGYFNILKSAKWLRDAVVDSWERGNKDLIGISHDVDCTSGIRVVGGKKMRAPIKITGVTVDVVYEPAAGGKFLRLAGAMKAGQKEEETMTRLLAALKAKRPDAYKTIEPKIQAGTITEDEVIELLAAAPTDGKGADLKGSGEPKKEDDDVLKAAKDTLQEAKLLSCANVLDRELAASELPEHAQERLRKLYAGQVFETEKLKAAIQDEKVYLDKVTGSGRVSDPDSSVRMLRSSEDKLQAAMDKFVGAPIDDKDKDVPEFKSLRAAYVEMTGDTEVRGYITDPRKLKAAFSSNTFSYVLGNSLYRRMVRDYREAPDYGAGRLVSEKRNAKDFRSLETVRVSYFGDLPDVSPETNDYPDLGVLTDEKVDYTLNQKGGTITITRRMIINDDMSLVNKIVSRLPRAARRTLAKRIWNKFISNATYKGDNKAVFHADHANLGSTAYSVAALVAAIKALKDMTESGSNEKLLLKAVTLAIPTALWDTALKINRTQGDPGTANHGNPVYQYFGANDEGIFENPFMTDATDWMLFADPKDVEMIELAFLNGQEEPEMFVADNPVNGQMFVADKIQYKTRHEYEAEIVDFRGCYKAVVAG